MRATLQRLVDRLRRRGETPVPVTPVSSSLFRGHDPRRGELAHPNLLLTAPDLRRRSPLTPQWLYPWATDRVGRAHAAGAVDDAAHRLIDQYLGALLDGEWQATEREHRDRTRTYQVIQAQQLSLGVETQVRHDGLLDELSLVTETVAWNRSQLCGVAQAPAASDLTAVSTPVLLLPPTARTTPGNDSPKDAA